MKEITTECQLIVGHIISTINRYNIDKQENEQVSLTIKRMQAILYLSQIEYIKHFGENLFEDEFHAWQYGPVIPGIYNMYLNYTTKYNEAIKFPEGKLTKEKQRIINSILSCTNNMDTYELINCCHFIDDLWKRNYNPYDKNHRQIIKKNEILSYHRKKCNPSIVSRITKTKNRH